MPNEILGPSYERIRQMTCNYRNSQSYLTQDQIELRNRLWSEFLGWWNHRHTTPQPDSLNGVRGWYESFYHTIIGQGCTIPQTAPHLIKFGETSANYEDVYFPSDGMNEMNVIVRFYNGDSSPSDVEIVN